MWVRRRRCKQRKGASGVVRKQDRLACCFCVVDNIKQGIAAGPQPSLAMAFGGWTLQLFSFVLGYNSRCHY